MHSATAALMKIRNLGTGRALEISGLVSLVERGRDIADRGLVDAHGSCYSLLITERLQQQLGDNRETGCVTRGPLNRYPFDTRLACSGARLEIWGSIAR